MPCCQAFVGSFQTLAPGIVHRFSMILVPYPVRDFQQTIHCALGKGDITAELLGCQPDRLESLGTSFTLAATRCTVVMRLRSESKGTSATRGKSSSKTSFTNPIWALATTRALQWDHPQYGNFRFLRRIPKLHHAQRPSYQQQRERRSHH